MPNLSDVKLSQRNETEELITNQSNKANYLYEGWGSKFSLQDFVQTKYTEEKTHYPDDGYIGFQSVKTIKPKLQVLERSISELNPGEIICDPEFDGISKIVLKN